MNRCWTSYFQARHRPLSAGGVDVDAALLQDFVKRASRAFGGRLKRYPNQHIIPLLERRGLVHVQHPGVLGGSRIGYTEAGQQADDDLDRWLTAGMKPRRSWAAADPGRAAWYTSGAGAAVLLLAYLAPEIAPLSRLLAAAAPVRNHGGEGYAAFVGPQQDGGDRLDVSAMVDFDPTSLDGVDFALSSIDVAFADIAGGGDGGGGGGDGGGGGG